MSARKKRRISLGNPSDTAHFETLMATGKKQMTHQKRLWRELRAAMARGRKDQGDDWRATFIRLLLRTARHEQLIQRSNWRGVNFIFTRTMKPKRPSLRLVRGHKT